MARSIWGKRRPKEATIADINALIKESPEFSETQNPYELLSSVFTVQKWEDCKPGSFGAPWFQSQNQAKADGNVGVPGPSPTRSKSFNIPRKSISGLTKESERKPARTAMPNVTPALLANIAKCFARADSGSYDGLLDSEELKLFLDFRKSEMDPSDIRTLLECADVKEGKFISYDQLKFLVLHCGFTTREEKPFSSPEFQQDLLQFRYFEKAPPTRNPKDPLAPIKYPKRTDPIHYKASKPKGRQGNEIVPKEDQRSENPAIQSPPTLPIPAASELPVEPKLEKEKAKAMPDAV